MWRWKRMAMGRCEAEQRSLWVASQELARSPGHPFYDKLNEVLEAGGFDRFVETVCAPHEAQAAQGQPDRGRFDDVRIQRGYDVTCAPRHQRGLEDVRAGPDEARRDLG